MTSASKSRFQFPALKSERRGSAVTESRHRQSGNHGGIPMPYHPKLNGVKTRAAF
jgi:hypothetical protein